MSKKKLVPRLRFREFDNSEKWESYKLSELSEINPRTKLPDNFRYVSLESVKNNFLVSYEITTRIDAPSRAQRLAKKGDIFFQTVRPYQKNNLLFDIIDSNYVFSSGYAQIRTHMNEKFLFYKLMDNRFVGKVLARSTGTSYPAIKPDDLAEISILIPSDESEQNKIGSLFKQLDEMIQLQQSKINKVKNIKSAYLSEMFPKEGEKYPKRRFEGFTEPWEEYKLKDMGRSLTGLSGKSKKDFGHGEAEFVTYMNVFNNPIAKSTQTAQVEVDENQTEVEYGDIFFTVSSETPNEVGMSSVWLYNRPNVYLNSFCFGFRPTVNLNPYYMAYMLRSPEIRKRFILLAQGISRYNISKTKAMELLFPIPSNEEQEKIGQFFKNLDNQISTEEEKLVKLEKLKQAYLNDMFV